MLKIFIPPLQQLNLTKPTLTKPFYKDETSTRHTEPIISNGFTSGHELHTQHSLTTELDTLTVQIIKLFHKNNIRVEVLLQSVK